MQKVWDEEGYHGKLSGIAGYQYLKQAVNSVGTHSSQKTSHYPVRLTQAVQEQYSHVRLQILAPPHQTMTGRDIATLDRSDCEYHRRPLLNDESFHGILNLHPLTLLALLLSHRCSVE